jgi:hypothetical protein
MSTSDSDSDVDLIGWEDPSEGLEFDKHNIGCLVAVVKLIKTAKFRFHSKSGWNVSRRLQEMIGEPDNSVQIADLAYYVRLRHHAAVPKYITNDLFEAPGFWLHYLDPLPIDVILPEEVRICLNSIYNRPLKPGSFSTDNVHTLRRTFRLLHPSFKREFMQRVVWGNCGRSKFTCEELQRMGWNANSNPCWLLSVVWNPNSDVEAKFTQNEEKLERLFPGYYSNKVCKISRKSWIMGKRVSSFWLHNKMAAKFCNRFDIWPLVSHGDRAAATVFYQLELELQRASYLIVELGLPPKIAWHLAEDRALRQTNCWKKMFAHKPTVP